MFQVDAEARIMRPRPASLAEELVSFNTCQELESHINQLPKPYHSSRAYGGIMVLAKRSGPHMDAPVPEAMSLAAEASVSGPAQVTGTNNQVEKVDEADFVKFNGKHIFQLHDGTLKILKAWPASEMNLISSLPVAGHPQEMLINDTSAAVLSSTGDHLKVSIVDISQPANPRLLTEFEIPGQYRTARLIGDTLRIVNQDYQSFMAKHPRQIVPSSGGWLQEETPAPKLDIKPTKQNLNGLQRTLDVVKDCKKIYAPKSTTASVLTRLISIDLKNKKYEEAMAFVSPETVYASESSIYLAQQGYKDGQQTAIHKFAFAPQSVHYQATGVVRGHLINQFAMDEHKGYLRLATNENQVSRIQVLTVKGKSLSMVGQTPDLAKGERLYSARFEGDKGFIVTFRQVDPLFTIDLRNPYRPRVVGELKIPGFSTYIHMINDTHLLTIGHDADENTGRTRGLKLSVFDVSNFARPREVKNLVFNPEVASEASYEHKAFTFNRTKGVLAIPASKGSDNSLLLFQVSTSNIKAAGEITMSDLQSTRRSFFADNIVYAIGETGVRAAAIDNPQSPVSTVLFNQSVADAAW